MDKIQNYAIIGNGRSAALVSKEGSIDWLCWPRFESPSIFGAILDQEKGGFWKITPSAFTHIERTYIEDTNVLQTTFYTSSGVLCLIDLMVALSEEEKQIELQPEHELIRALTCVEGEITVNIHFFPRPHYGKRSVRLHDKGRLGIRCEIDQYLLNLRTDVHCTPLNDQAQATFSLKTGEKRYFSLTYTLEGPAILPPIGTPTAIKIQKTIAWWQQWAQPCKRHGTAVVRSALTLKLMNFAPSGAFIAAPTTSLPERIGGDLNWDYRFCWIRDSAFTVHALLRLGYKDEAAAFISWLLHSTRLTLPRLNVLYDVYGKIPRKEKILSHLKGYLNSKPVRIGNGAQTQFQLDCYGEVIEAVAYFVNAGGQLDKEMKKMLRLFGMYICQQWEKPDHGIWEYREAQYHYTYSKVMAWVALDRLIALNKKPWINDKTLALFYENRERLEQAIEKKGWNSQLQSYTTTFEGETVDASLMLLAFYGFKNIDSPRMQGTYKLIQERLSSSSAGLIFRSEKGLADQEGAFVMCSFWGNEFLARGGAIEQAKKQFNHIYKHANDVGLFSEEIDVKTGDALGNFPQAFTHIALINSFLSIKERQCGLG